MLPGFGLMDLGVTWRADWPQVLEAGWGLFATVIVGAAFLLVAVRPPSTTTAVAQLAVASFALAVSALFAEEPGLLWFAAGLVAQTGILAWLGRGRLGPFRMQPSRPLLVLGALGVVPWLVYASRMWAANREGRPDADLTVGIDHYSMQGALGVSLGLLPLVAAVLPRARPFPVVCAGIAAFYLALVSLAWPDAAAGLSRAWSVAAIAWAFALPAVVVRWTGRPNRRERPGV